jgi:hypothetical protein
VPREPSLRKRVKQMSDMLQLVVTCDRRNCFHT